MSELLSLAHRAIYVLAAYSRAMRNHGIFVLVWCSQPHLKVCAALPPTFSRQPTYDMWWHCQFWAVCKEVLSVSSVVTQVLCVEVKPSLICSTGHWQTIATRETHVNLRERDKRKLIYLWDRVPLCCLGRPGTYYVVRSASNTQLSSCLCLSSAGVKGVLQHVQLMLVWFF